MKKWMMAVALVVLGCGALAMLTLSARAAAPAGHFTDLGDGTVRDNLTGLVWQQGFSPSGQSQADSVTYCLTLTVPSGGGWRLPTVGELQTLVDETVERPSIDAVYFPGTPLQWFWSSSVDARLPSYGWYVHFFDGHASNDIGVTDSGGAAWGGRARCVR